MTLSNRAVCDACWLGERAENRNMKSDGIRLWSYWNVILQRTADGVTIGNATKYSQTTSCHQSVARVMDAEVVLTGLPIGVSNLEDFRYRDDLKVKDRTDVV